MTERTKKIYHFSLILISFLLISGLFIYVDKNSAAFSQLKNLRLDIIFALILIHILHFYFLGLTQSSPLKKHNILLTFREWFGLCLSSELLNILLPANGGTGVRMLYLNENKRLPIREFLSLSFAMLLIGFSFLGFIGLVYCQFFLKKNHMVFSILESLFLSLIISGVVLMFATEAFGKIFKFKRKISPKSYLKDLKLTSFITLCWSGMFALYPLKIYLSFLAIGVHLNFSQSLEFSLVLLVASLFQVLPGNIGVKEIVTAYIGKQYGIQIEVALLASLIDRAILMLFLFPVGLYFYWELFLGASLPTLSLLNPRPKRLEQTSP